MRVGDQQGAGTAPQPVQEGHSATTVVNQMGEFVMQGR